MCEVPKKKGRYKGRTSTRTLLVLFKQNEQQKKKEIDMSEEKEEWFERKLRELHDPEEMNGNGEGCFAGVLIVIAVFFLVWFLFWINWGAK